MDLYQTLLRPLLFRLDAESAHNVALHALGLTPAALLETAFGPRPVSPVRLFGLDFPNPVGLAAGMDKNAAALRAWPALGFGFVELGTVTLHAQPGNDKPRCFRYPDKQALINRMGFNNDGAEAIARRLETLRATGQWPDVPVGINLGKSKITPLADAPEDYAGSFRRLRSLGDYFVINVSSPNTPGLRSLQDESSLQAIIRAIRNIDSAKPLLVKIAPDLPEDALAGIARLAERERADGLIATNTTLDHSAIPQARDENGGLSGTPLEDRAMRILEILKSHTRLPVIASGGIMTAEAAARRLEAGASLVQLYTGFVYRGPSLIRAIARTVGAPVPECGMPQPTTT